MQIAILSKNNKNNILNSLVPMFGDSFFTFRTMTRKRRNASCFRPHVWGSFFHEIKRKNDIDKLIKFSSPCLGILFSLDGIPPFIYQGRGFSSPCLGILFSPYYGKSEKRIYGEVFVPMFGDSFFTHSWGTLNVPFRWGFSSPCLGILFSPKGRWE